MNTELKQGENIQLNEEVAMNKVDKIFEFFNKYPIIGFAFSMGLASGGIAGAIKYVKRIVA